MFTKSKDTDSAVTQPTPAKRTNRTGVPSIISSDLTVVGTLISSGDVQVDGRIEGDIRAGALVIGDEASIQGDVYAEDAIIRGRVEGGIRAKKVKLCATAHVEGDILHEALSMESGAFFEGNCRHSDNPLSDAPALRESGIAVQAVRSGAPTTTKSVAPNGSASNGSSETHGAAAPARAAASFTPLDR
jgi:cytoskeletal protein CcmA (bactofilin family)